MSHFKTEDEARTAWSDAIFLAKKGEGRTALAIFYRLANDGYQGAAYTIGSLFERGLGDTPADGVKAEEWYQRAVLENNDAEARFHLARVILRNHTQVDEEGRRRIDYALMLWRELSDEGYDKAAIALGSAFFEGALVDRDIKRSEYYFQKAADSGYIIAFVFLSRIAWIQKKPCRAIMLRLSAICRFSVVFFKNQADDRLFLMPYGK